jgi:hypothetical protein
LSSITLLLLRAGTPRRIPRPDYLSSFFRAAAAGNGLYDLGLFAGTGVLDKVPDVDDAIGAGVRALEAGVMRLYGVVMILGGWVRRLRGRLIHVNTSSVLAAPPGD